MQIHIISTLNGDFDFDVAGLNNVYRAVVSRHLEPGESFNVYYGESSKSSCTWLGDSIQNMQYDHNKLKAALEESLKMFTI
jgi:hypothetical protein